jgi:hypothetical protein
VMYNNTKISSNASLSKNYDLFCIIFKNNYNYCKK